MTAAVPIAFAGGLLLGSFATVVAHRLPRGESFMGGRSRCPSCGATIAAYDNIPLLSYLFLRGRCRSCGARISPRYPLTELGTAVLFALTTLVLGTGDAAELALGLCLCAVLVIVTLTDLEQKLIPNVVLIAGAVAAVAIVAVDEPSSFGERAVAAVGAGGFLFLAALAYPGGMGMGDVKLAALLGLYLGDAVIAALVVAVVTGALVGIAVLISQGSGARKRAIPFGPFLALGGIVGLLAGDEMLDWYLDSFIR